MTSDVTQDFGGHSSKRVDMKGTQQSLVTKIRHYKSRTRQSAKVNLYRETSVLVLTLDLFCVTEMSCLT